MDSVSMQMNFPNMSTFTGLASLAGLVFCMDSAPLALPEGLGTLQ
jgi:hypothetical protein